MRTTDERIGGKGAALKTMYKKIMLELRVAMPGIIQAFDEATQTASVSIAIREKLSMRGVESETEIPLLVDVPVVMPRAGGYMLAFKPKAGDECLVVFADRCIDSWWQSGGIQSQADCRRHDLSDGFAIIGCWSQTRKPTLPARGVSLQNDDGSVGVFIEDGSIRLKGDSIEISGNLSINGQAYAQHRHGGVESGNDETGGVS